MKLSRGTVSLGAMQNSWLPGSWTMGKFPFSQRMNQDINVSSEHMELLSFMFLMYGRHDYAVCTLF